MVVNVKKKYIPYRSWSAIRNIGDRINPNVIENVSKLSPMEVDGSMPHLLGIGSIFFLANKNSYVWGSGFLGENSSIPPMNYKNIRALRGKKTADLFVKSGITLGDIPFGDPGIFVENIMDLSICDFKKKYSEILLIPHYSNYKNMLNKYGKTEEIEILDPCTDSLEFVKKILFSKYVISESLHGIIFAIALGKRTTWIGKEESDYFKYHDWFSMVECPPNKPLHYNSNVVDLIKLSEKYNLICNKKDLSDNFPHELAIEQNNLSRISYQKSREMNPFITILTREMLGIDKDINISANFLYDKGLSYVDKFFKNWDEKPYILISILNEGLIPTNKQLNRILYEMDHHPEHNFCVFTSKSYIETYNKNAKKHHLADNVSWVEGNLSHSTTILLRPLKERGNRYVAFFDL